MTREDLLKAMTKPLYQADLQRRMVPGDRTDAEFEEEWLHWQTVERHKKHLPMHAAHELAEMALAAIEASGCAVVPLEPTREMLHVTALSSSHRSVEMREKADIYRWMLKETPFRAGAPAQVAQIGAVQVLHDPALPPDTMEFHYSDGRVDRFTVQR